MQIARDSHYVPAGYFKPWLDSDRRIWAYRLLVPSESYPRWERRAISGVPVRRDIYTSVAQGTESDEIERWLNKDVETPAWPVLDRLRTGATLTPDETRRLVRFVAALDARGPVAYSDHTELASQLGGEILTSILSNAVQEVQRKADAGEALTTPPEPREQFPSVQVKITPDPTDAEPHRTRVQVDATIGRELWIQTLRRVVDEHSPVLEQHSWQVLQSYPGWHWFASDHPVFRLAYFGPDKYDFDAGWNSPGCEIMMPISATQLLYTRVGCPRRSDEVLTRTQTETIQRMIARRAHRWIFSERRSKRIERLRPRVVDRALYMKEEGEWKNFHRDQSAAVLRSGDDEPRRA